MADSVDSISTTSRKNESPRITSDTVPTSPHVVTFVKTSPRDNPTVDATTGVHKTPSSEATVSEQPGIDTVPETSVEMESFQAAGSPDSLPIERHVEPSPPTKESAVPLPDHSPEIRRRSQSPRNSQNNGKGHHKSSKKDKEFSFRISPLNNEIHSSSYSPTSSERRLSVECKLFLDLSINSSSGFVRPVKKCPRETASQTGMLFLHALLTPSREKDPILPPILLCPLRIKTLVEAHEKFYFKTPGIRFPKIR